VDPAELDCADPDCDCRRQVIRKETTWHLEREVQSSVVVTHRLVRACPHHHGGPVIAPVPPKPVDKGHLGFGLAAHAIYLRYSHNLPIRRIADMLADDLVPVSEEMLDRLYTETSARIEPVLQALITCVRQAQLVNLDDTPVLVLDPKRPNRRRTGHMWVAVGDQRYCWFFSTPSWRSEEAETRLGTLTGTLQGDGYTAFRKMAKKLGIRLAGCMAHLRRKLRKAMLAKDPRATAVGPHRRTFRRDGEPARQGLDLPQQPVGLSPDLPVQPRRQYRQQRRGARPAAHHHRPEAVAFLPWECHIRARRPHRQPPRHGPPPRRRRAALPRVAPPRAGPTRVVSRGRRPAPPRGLVGRAGEEGGGRCQRRGVRGAGPCAPVTCGWGSCGWGSAGAYVAPIVPTVARLWRFPGGNRTM